MYRCAACKQAAGCGPSTRTTASTRAASQTLHAPSSTWSPSLTAPSPTDYIPRASLYVTPCLLTSFYCFSYILLQNIIRRQIFRILHNYIRYSIITKVIYKHVRHVHCQCLCSTVCKRYTQSQVHYSLQNIVSLISIFK